MIDNIVLLTVDHAREIIRIITFNRLALHTPVKIVFTPVNCNFNSPCTVSDRIAVADDRILRAEIGGEHPEVDLVNETFGTIRARRRAKGISSGLERGNVGSRVVSSNRSILARAVEYGYRRAGIENIRRKRGHFAPVVARRRRLCSLGIGLNRKNELLVFNLYRALGACRANDISFAR